MSVPGARCLTGFCAAGSAGTLVLGGWTYQGHWGAGNLLQGRGNVSKEDGTVITGERYISFFAPRVGFPLFLEICYIITQ